MLSNSNIAVVAYDAGAANHIKSWMQTGTIDLSKVKLSVDGPAKTIFSKEFPALNNFSLKEVLLDASLLISGTGWASSLEHDSRVAAKNKGIKTVAVLDHWVNYKQRFIRNGCVELPNEIWVTDKYALEISEKEFENINIVLRQNDYITQQVKLIESKNNFNVSNKKENILFLMEPIRDGWPGDDTPGEIQSFRYFVENMKFLDLGINIEIYIKPHPSDQKGKYEFLLKENENLNMQINNKESLAELIAWADIIVGCQTYAMVIAIAAGKKVISAIPLQAPKCMLPQQEIIMLSELVK